MINDVYNLVQELLNKNGYGILSPIRFMLFAQQSQIKLLMNAVDTTRREKQRKDAISHDDSLKVQESIINMFTTTELISRFNGTLQKDYHFLPEDYMRFEEATIGSVDVVKVESSMKGLLGRSSIMNPTLGNPYCYIEGKKMFVLPKSIGVIADGATNVRCDEVNLTYIRYPKKPVWTYALIHGKESFNISDPNYQDFELPYSMFDKLVTDILAQGGVHIRDEYVSTYSKGVETTEFNKDNI